MIYMVWIDLLKALLTPVLAVAAVAISVFNYRLAVNKRRDDLFDRRYQFYKDFERFWKTTGSESEGATQMQVEWDDIVKWELEAGFLFGDDIAKHIRSYEGKSYSGVRWVPDTDLAKPVKKYLSFN